MQPLVEAGLIQVNSRGHYRVPAKVQSHASAELSCPPPGKSPAKIVGDNYFPTLKGPMLIEGDYFPNAD